ncbi:hypothetical protein [Novosphingobium sp. BL-52-GroH]|uniref:hypothetical protein n=1 Tax=Novosphingobium sp. BL-52-GroH TaxID=3349877 RepID=UPI00384C941D
MIAACPDAMVESIAVAGPPDYVRERVAQRARHADAITPVVPHHGLSQEKAVAYGQRIADVFYE